MRPANPRTTEPGRPVTYHGARGSGVEPLPALVVGDGTIRTEWELTFEERGAILEGARVVVTFLGGMFPCALSVEGVEGA